MRDLNLISGAIVDAAMKVHSRLGPGLLEGVYEAVLKHELQLRKLKVLSQVAFPVVYEEVQIELGYRLDLLVEDAVIVEIKAIEKLHPIHSQQLLSYLRLSNLKLGLLINFNVAHLKTGVHRIANGL